MSERIADRVFAAQMEWGLAREAAVDAILEAIGCNPQDTKTWPRFHDFTFDDYDSSFEMKEVADPAFEFTPEAWQKCQALGFERAWICYCDGSERYYCGTHAAYLKPAPEE